MALKLKLCLPNVFISSTIDTKETKSLLFKGYKTTFEKNIMFINVECNLKENFFTLPKVNRSVKSILKLVNKNTKWWNDLMIEKY